MTAAISDGKVTTAPSAPAAAIAAVEFPTLLLLLGTYGGWLAITSRYGHWPTAVVVPLTVVLMALHSSLQHELVHGHPTRWYGVNRLLGIVPLSLWMPFVRYRQTHLVHHRDERLTDPRDDPESYYWTAEDLARLSPPTRLMLRIQQTLAGRIIIGSFWRIGMYQRAGCARDLVRTPAVVRTGPALGDSGVRHAVLVVSGGHGLPRQRHHPDPLLRRTSRSARRARAHRDRRALVDPRPPVPVQ
jgi:fatty acid desaturase